MMRRAGHGLAIALLLALAACTPSTTCGTFSYTGASIPTGGISCQVSFSFDASTCAAPACTCDTIAYVQIVRIIDRDSGNFIQPHSEQTNRMVTGNTNAAYNGWAVDRLFGRIWGYYGRNDDGTFGPTLIPGNNSTPSVLRDTPQGWAPNVAFDAVSVPVCIANGATCVNRLLGYEWWAFVVQSGGAGSNPSSGTAQPWHRDVFNLAIAEWNTDATGLGKNAFAAMSPLP